MNQLKSRKNSLKFESWYGWRKNKETEKYKTWVKKIKETATKSARIYQKRRHLQKQKLFDYDVQRKIELSKEKT